MRIPSWNSGTSAEGCPDLALIAARVLANNYRAVKLQTGGDERKAGETKGRREGRQGKGRGEQSKSGHDMRHAYKCAKQLNLTNAVDGLANLSI